MFSIVRHSMLSADDDIGSDRVVNVPLQYIAKDLGFSGNALVQGMSNRRHPNYYTDKTNRLLDIERVLLNQGGLHSDLSLVLQDLWWAYAW